MPARKVLVVDDEDDIREVTQMSLELVGGWDVLTARSGREGVVAAAAHRPDAILLDVMMPEMDGPATFQELQRDERTRHIPVVLLTARVQAADRRRFEELGVKTLIPKPFDPIKLPSELAAALGWPT